MFSEDYEVGKTALGSAKRAMDPTLTDGELATLARSDEVKVRAIVAERYQTPLTSLLRLADDEAPQVRAGVARNPRQDIPLEIRERLAHDRSPEVVFAVIKSAGTPEAILKGLTRGMNREVTAAAKAQLKVRKVSGGLAAVGQMGLASS